MLDVFNAGESSTNASRNKFARSVESRLEPLADFDAVMKHEQAISKSLDGRTVLDDKQGSRFYVGRSGQRSLF